MANISFRLIIKGGKGSGNWGHAGRPGKVGGSAPRDSAPSAQGELFNRDKYLVYPPDADEDVLSFLLRHGNTSKEAGEAYAAAINSGYSQNAAALMVALGFDGESASRIDEIVSGDYTLNEFEADVIEFTGKFDADMVDNVLWLSKFTPKLADAMYLYGEIAAYNDSYKGYGGDGFPMSYVRDFAETVYTADSLGADGLFSTGVTEIRVDNRDEYSISIRFAGEVLYDGDFAGKFIRTVTMNDGILEVHHDLLNLYTQHRGKGFGADYYSNLEYDYGYMGVSNITLEADLGVGGYAWARMGYDFQNPYLAESMTEDFKRVVKGNYGIEPSLPEDSYSPPERWHSWEIASYIAPNGSPAGKDFMLGTDWNAKKYLGYDDDGCEVGEKYYESKKSSFEKD